MNAKRWLLPSRSIYITHTTRIRSADSQNRCWKVCSSAHFPPLSHEFVQNCISHSVKAVLLSYFLSWKNHAPPKITLLYFCHRSRTGKLAHLFSFQTAYGLLWVWYAPLCELLVIYNGVFISQKMLNAKSTYINELLLIFVALVCSVYADVTQIFD